MDGNDWLVQLRKGTIELCILALLTERERYGYEIVQELNAPGEVIIAEGTIYPLLRRLSDEGHIAATWRESPSGPPRKYYRLTVKGRIYLRRIAAQWRQFSSFVNHVVGGADHDKSESGGSEARGGVSGATAPKPLRVLREREG